MIKLDRRIKQIANGVLPEDELNIVLNDMLVSDNLYQRKIAEGASVMMRRKVGKRQIAKEMLDSNIESPRIYNRNKSDVKIENSTQKQSSTINSIIRTYFTAKERNEFKDAGVKIRIEKLPEDIAGQNKGRQVLIDPEIAERADGITEDVVVHELIHAQNRLREEKKPNIYLRKESIIDGPEDIRNDTEIEESVTEAMTTARLQTFDATSKEPIPTKKGSLDRRYNSKITKSYNSKRINEPKIRPKITSTSYPYPSMKIKNEWLFEAGPKHWESKKYVKKRKFSNKEFERFDGTGFRTSKSEAMLRAERLRDLGNNARVVKYATGYGVYYRRPKTPIERQIAQRRKVQRAKLKGMR